MVIRRGEIWWADLSAPIGSGPGYRRPVLVVQDDNFNISGIKTVVIAVISSNIGLARAKGNVLISPRQSGLSKDSVVNISQLITIDKSLFLERVEILSNTKMEQVDSGLRTVLSLNT